MTTGHHGPRANLNYTDRKKLEQVLLSHCHGAPDGAAVYDEGHSDHTVAAETGEALRKTVSPASVANLRTTLIGHLRGSSRIPMLPLFSLSEQPEFIALQVRTADLERRVAALEKGRVGWLIGGAGAFQQVNPQLQPNVWPPHGELKGTTQP